MSEFLINNTFTGKVAPLGESKFLTAIVKKLSSRNIDIDQVHFGDDEVHNKKHHGGIHRVLHQYASEHYTYWEKIFPAQTEKFSQGSYGENICTTGVDETRVCVGDLWQIGTALLEVSEARFPCATLNLRYQNPDYLKALMAVTKWGWFYRVIRAGTIASGNTGQLKERPNPQLTLATTIDVIMRRNQSPELVQLLRNCPQLSPQWRDKASKL